MSETYNDIVKEVKRLDEEQWSPLTYCVTHGCALDDTKTADADMALHLCKRVRDAVARDYKEWWVEDGNGNQVYIGDRFTDAREQAEEVCALGDCAIVGDSGDVFDARICEKVIPDTREKIIDYAVESLMGCGGAVDTDEVRDIIGDAVDRAMKLGAER